jgi:hypothetical protein
MEGLYSYVSFERTRNMIKAVPQKAGLFFMRSAKLKRVGLKSGSGINGAEGSFIEEVTIKHFSAKELVNY